MFLSLFHHSIHPTFLSLHFSLRRIVSLALTIELSHALSIALSHSQCLAAPFAQILSIELRKNVKHRQHLDQ